MNKIIQNHPERDNYIDNRDIEIINFEINLEYVQKSKPSVGGKINEMDYQQFAIASIFNFIIEQEDYANEEWAKCDYIDVKEEKQILNKCIKQVKKVFGKEYNNMYNKYKDNKTVD